MLRGKDRIMNPKEGEKKDHKKKREVQKHEKPEAAKVLNLDFNSINFIIS